MLNNDLLSLLVAMKRLKYLNNSLTLASCCCQGSPGGQASAPGYSNYNSQFNVSPASFSDDEDYDNEPPLLEELGEQDDWVVNNSLTFFFLLLLCPCNRNSF